MRHGPREPILDARPPYDLTRFEDLHPTRVMEGTLLTDIVTLLVVSIGVLYASHYVRLPPIVGFLISGILLGPHGLGLVQEAENVQQLAEIGVVMLLFTIGLVFSLADL